MKNKTIVRIATIFIFIFVLASVASTVLGYTDINSFKGNTTGDSAQKTQTLTQQIIGIVQIIGMSAAVIMLIVLGMKYVSAAPSEKADIKKGAMLYVVGAVLLLATAGILQIVKSFVTDIATGQAAPTN